MDLKQVGTSTATNEDFLVTKVQRLPPPTEKNQTPRLRSTPSVFPEGTCFSVNKIPSWLVCVT